jgi:beta-glucuronidase
MGVDICSKRLTSSDPVIRTCQLLCLMALGWFCAPVGYAATRIDLNTGWAFITDPGNAGEKSGWAKQAPAGGELVDVPHSWNRRVGADYLGVAWYFRTFELPSLPADGHVELNFGATFYSARVWLNGEEIGSHEGGFTAYSFDITRRLRATNTLAVAIDNRPGMTTIPGYGARGTPDAWYDWWAYGGIVRDVWLSVSGPVHVKRQRIGSEIEGSGATVSTRVALVNSLERAANVTVKATALDPENRPVATQSRSVRLEPGAQEVALSMKLAQAKLWSLDRPNVYRMQVEVAGADGKASDSHSDSFGVRRIEIRNRHLLLNGERVRLTGMTRHEDSPWEGLAETAGTMRYDYDDMKALHTTVSRPVHYPQHPFILDYADRNGVLMIPEIPIWQFSEAQLGDPKVLALAKQQMREMIEESGNHPSIFAWSVANESATGSPAGIAFFRAMRDYIRGLDPVRFVTYADDNLPKLGSAAESAANDADFLLMNQYFGAWHGPAEALGAALDKVDRLFPDKMVMISEFGFPGIFASNPQEADRKRVEIIRTQLPELARRDWIAGAMLWCYQDYRSRRNLWPGQVEGYVEHGLVDERRQRKPSYAVWKELNAPAKIEAMRAASGFTATVTPNAPDRIPSYPLRDYRLVWQAFGDDGKQVARGENVLADLTRAQTVSGNLPTGSARRVTLQLLRPNGSVAAERVLE